MEVRRILGCVSGAADVAQYLAFAHFHSLLQSVGIMVEVGVVVAPRPRQIELVDGKPARPAGEKLFFGLSRWFCS